MGPPCIHGDGTSLCGNCREAYETDPDAYIEFGDHPEGMKRWAAELRLREVDLAGPPTLPPDPNLPL